MISILQSLISQRTGLLKSANFEHIVRSYCLTQRETMRSSQLDLECTENTMPMSQVLRYLNNFTDPNSSLNPNSQLLVEPYLNGRVLLEELEYKVDRRQKHLASTTSAASVHLEVGVSLVWRLGSCVWWPARRAENQGGCRV